MRTALCTDSAACLPAGVIERLGILVAPLSVTVDGVLTDDLAMDNEEFFDQLAAGVKPTTSQPSPGTFLQLYKQAAQDGAERVLSIHIGSSLSGTVASARIAAESSPVPVEVVDSGTASFQQGLCVWEAAEALASGSDVGDATDVALKAAQSSGNIFIVGALKFAAQGGRLVGGDVEGVPVLSVGEKGIAPVGNAQSVDEAIEIMTTHIAVDAAKLDGQRLRIGVTHIHAPEMARRFKEKISAINQVEGIMDYSLVPSMASHTGPGTVSAVYLARPVR
ncbi:MAG TPA: DegV family protein [Dehalococcoidia bacterium]|nr:DegV family protein [Dehalococcoidia bacterium]